MADHHLTATNDDVQRVQETLGRIGGPSVMWGAKHILEVITAEQRLRAEQAASRRMLRATWVLVGATVVLAVATVALIFATIAD
jgi:CHASE3 domain sensor protein